MIEVGRNSIIIRDVDFESDEYQKFFNSFSIYDPIIHKRTTNVITIIDKDIYVPASIGAEYVHYFFPEKKVNINYATTAKSSQMKYEMINRPKNNLQSEALVFLSRMKNDYNKRERFLSLATGTGKTFVTISLLASFQTKAMIVVDTAELATQWKREFLKHSTVDPDRIQILSGRESVNDSIQNPQKYDIYIAMHKTLWMLLEEDSNSVNLLMNKLKIGIRVFDEAHQNFKNICKINSLSNVEYTIFLTATPSRSNFRDDTIYGRVFGKVPFYNGESDSHYINIILYKFNSMPNETDKLKVRTQHGLSGVKWGNYILEDSYQQYIECLTDIFENLKLMENVKKIGIVLPINNLISKTKEDLDQFLDIDCGVFIGSMKEEKREEAKSKVVFITNDKMFDKAIDIPDLEVLINFCPFSSDVKLDQMVGRIRYKSGKSHVFIDVTDVGFRECKSQLSARKRYYKNSNKVKAIKEMKL